MSNFNILSLLSLSDEDFDKTILSKAQIFEILSKKLNISKFRAFLLVIAVPTLLIFYILGLLQISNIWFVFVPLMQCFYDFRNDYSSNSHWTGYWIMVSITLVFEEIFRPITSFIPYIFMRSFILFICLYNDGAEHFLNNFITPIVDLVYKTLLPGEEEKVLKNTKLNKSKNNTTDSITAISKDPLDLPCLPKRPDLHDGAIAAKEHLKDDDENEESKGDDKNLPEVVEN